MSAASQRVCAALAWNPRGEHGRLRRFYPQLQAIYSSIAVSVPPDADADAVKVLKALPGLVWTDEHWVSGRHTVMQAALATSADFIHYVDGDRLVRWIETRPEELAQTVARMQKSDCLVIGRTAHAFATHPMAQQQPEKLSNDVFSQVLGRPLDFSSGSKGFSRAAAEFLLRHSPPGNVMGTDSEWVILLHRAGFRIDAVDVDGLDWETADRYLDHAADAETQRRVAAEYDADPEHWSFRVRVAQDIIDAGFDALKREIEKD
jgi:hypothetical protein